MIRPHPSGMSPNIRRPVFIGFDNTDVVAIALCIFHIKYVDFMSEPADDLLDPQPAERPRVIASMSNVLVT